MRTAEWFVWQKLDKLAWMKRDADALRKELLLPEAAATPLGWVFWAGIGENHPGLEQKPMNTLGYYACVLALRGHAIHENARTAVPVEPGDLMIVFPNVPYRHYTRDDKPWSEVWFLFDGPAFKLWQDGGLISPERPVLRLGTPAYWHARVRAFVEPMSGTGVEQSLRRVSMLQEFLADALLRDRENRADPRDTAWLESACELIGPPPLHPPDWHKISHELGMTYEGFRKRFARLTGTSPAQYRAKQIIQLACNLLKSGRTVTQAASQAGFADPFYFSRQFKKHTGMSPSDYARGVGVRV